jgi:hypothetical protein
LIITTTIIINHPDDDNFTLFVRITTTTNKTLPRELVATATHKPPERSESAKRIPLLRTAESMLP